MLEEAIHDFLLAGLQSGWSEGTHRQHAYHLERWRKWLHARGIDELGDVDRGILRQWGVEINDGWKPATVRSAVKIVKRFLAWCHSEGLCGDLSDALKVPRVPRRLQRTVTAAEVRRMLAYCDDAADAALNGYGALWIRNGAIISLLFDSLLRASELVRLTIHDVDLAHHRLTVLVKGGDQCYALFGDGTARRLAAWLDVRPAVRGVDALFTTLGVKHVGKPLTVHGLRTMLATLSERVGIEHVTPHSFRRGGAVQAVLAGAHLRFVQEMGRWKSLDMVVLYTQHIRLESVFHRFSPVDSLGGHPNNPGDGQV